MGMCTWRTARRITKVLKSQYWPVSKVLLHRMLAKYKWQKVASSGRQDDGVRCQNHFAQLVVYL